MAKTVFTRPDFSGQLVGRYLLTNILGTGSSGTVYRAVDTTSKHAPAVAVKCLSKTKITSERGVQIITEIHHHDTVTGSPCVLALRYIIDEELYLFLVLDLCETDMHKAIWQRKLYWRNDELIREAFIEILDGVSACHEKEIFHRDLKPENIMCNADGTGIKIGDFGLSTHHRVCPESGCGTPCYMSPECWTSNEKDPYYGRLTDTWSLGVILFNMVTGRHPWVVALPSDREFAAFIDDEDHLFRTHPISEQLNVLLKWILHPIAKNRLPITAIREAIMDIDTFYKWRRPHIEASLVPKKVIFPNSSSE